MRIPAVKAFPSLKHGQRVNPNQARRFFQQARAWITLANRRVSELKNQGFLRNHSLENIGRGMISIKQNLEWLRNRGFENKEIGRELKALEERFARL